jgi:hypothetical protein
MMKAEHKAHLQGLPARRSRSKGSPFYSLLALLLYEPDDCSLLSLPLPRHSISRLQWIYST